MPKLTSAHVPTTTYTPTSFDTVIIGGGQAGLAMSRCLLDVGIPLESQVILERGEIGERWRSSYWDSLHLLTPNWQSRLPGNWSYTGTQPEGFMSKNEFVDFLTDFANSFHAPIQTNTNVVRVEEYEEEANDTARFRVTTTTTNNGDNNQTATTKIWLARNVVIATGYCDLPKIPAFANNIPSDNVFQLSAVDYKNPAQVLSWFRTKTPQASKPNDNTNNIILVVGAGASGVQIADELAEEVHCSQKNIQDKSASNGSPKIVISVGKHCRWPRTYRGKDTLWWIDQMGAFRANAVQEEEASSPGPQLTGYRATGQEARDANLYQLHVKWGVDIVGKMTLIEGDGKCIQFDNANLGACLKQADDGCINLLRSIDDFINQQGLDENNTSGLTGSLFQTENSSGDTTICPRLPYNQLSSRSCQIDLHPLECDETNICIIWATGFTRDYPFLSELLHQKLWDPERRILRNHGGIVTIQPKGLYILGYRWLRRKHSNFVVGVGDDARELAEHIWSNSR